MTQKRNRMSKVGREVRPATTTDGDASKQGDALARARREFFEKKPTQPKNMTPLQKRMQSSGP